MFPKILFVFLAVCGSCQQAYSQPAVRSTAPAGAPFNERFSDAVSKFETDCPKGTYLALCSLDTYRYVHGYYILPGLSSHDTREYKKNGRFRVAAKLLDGDVKGIIGMQFFAEIKRTGRTKQVIRDPLSSSHMVLNALFFISNKNASPNKLKPFPASNSEPVLISGVVGEGVLVGWFGKEIVYLQALQSYVKEEFLKLPFSGNYQVKDFKPLDNPLRKETK